MRYKKNTLEVGYVKDQLTVISEEFSKDKSVFVKVRCTCGEEFVIDRWRLVNKSTMCKHCAINRDRKSEDELRLKNLTQ